MTLRKAIRDFFNEVRKPSPEQKQRKLQKLTSIHPLPDKQRREVLELIKDAYNLNEKIYGRKGEELPLLVWAVRDNHPGIAKELLARGAFADIEGPGGMTPLMWAMVGGHIGLAEMLISNGANVNRPDSSGATPLVRAMEHAQYNRDYPVTDMLLLLIGAGAKLETKDHYGHTPLMNAVVHGWTTTVSLLIDKGAVIDPPDFQRYTTLMLAVGRGNKDMIRLLIDKGANINWQDMGGDTALSRAIHRGNDDIVKILLEKGVDLDVALKGAKKRGWANRAVEKLELLKQAAERNKTPADAAAAPPPAPAQVKPPVPK